MPITVKDIVEKVGLSSESIKQVQWGNPVNNTKEGIYIVSMSESPSENEPHTCKRIPISIDLLRNWMTHGEFKIDNKITNDVTLIKQRLSKFWLTDENIIYIGKAPLRKKGGGIGNRIREYYDTLIENHSPHAGGRWIKVLKNLNNMFVYYIECDHSSDVEAELLDIFGDQISKDNKNRLGDSRNFLPFANLENGKKSRKKHGLIFKKRR